MSCRVHGLNTGRRSNDVYRSMYVPTSCMHVQDTAGSTVLTLKKKSFSLCNKWYIFSGKSTQKADKIAIVKTQSASVNAEVS